jgi:hypothetical protein
VPKSRHVETGTPHGHSHVIGLLFIDGGAIALRVAAIVCAIECENQSREGADPFPFVSVGDADSLNLTIGED